MAQTSNVRPGVYDSRSRWQAIRSRARRISWLGVACAVGIIVYYSGVFIGPFVRAVWLAFHNWDYISTARFVGLRNFTRAFGDPNFWKAIRVTLVFSAGEISLALLVGLLIALLLYQLRDRWRRPMLVLYYLPIITPTVVTTYLFGWLYRPAAAGGALNNLLISLGLPGQPFMSSVQQALPSVTAMIVWMNFGGVVVLMLAGMSDVPPSLYEAAELDGAGFWRLFFSITLPLLRPVMAYLVVTSVIGTFQMFEPFFLLPAPSHSTRTIALFTYQLGFQSMNLGYGAALSLVMFLMLLGATVVQLQRFMAAFEQG